MNKRYSVETLLKNYRESHKPSILEVQYLNFPGIENKDVYNPSYPIKLDDMTILPCRVESRNSEHSEIVMFTNDCDDLNWKVAQRFQPLPLQDPFWTVDNSTVVIGGVDVEFSKNDDVVTWKTVFYEMNNFGDYSLLFVGPNKMKDIRFCPLKDGKIALFTRPQGDYISNRGQIGFTLLNSWEELTTDTIKKAPLLNLFEDDEWGGVNHAQVLPDGNIGVLGHIACYTEGNVKHYYPISFVFDPYNSKIIKEPKIILERSQLLPGPSKNPDLYDVIFPGGAVQENGGTTLYLGVSDASIQRVKMENIFK